MTGVRGSRRHHWRIAMIVAGGVVSLWFVLALTISTVLSSRQPERVLQWWPWSASATARQSEKLLQGTPDAEAIASARVLALEVLSREPANAMAARDLGLTYALEGRTAKAERLFSYAERLSRRDRPTQLWLIETNVQRGDVSGALRHYDRLMRTTVSSRETLIPILVQAAQTPDIAAALAKMVAQKPNWASDFISALVSQSSGAAALARIIPAARLDVRNPAQRDQLATALKHMVDLGAIRPAYRLYLSARRDSPAAKAVLRDGGFDNDVGLIPFEWQLAAGDGHEAVREQVDGANGQALSLVGNIGGEMARQILLLSPGQYRLSGLSGSVPVDDDARPSVSIICVAATPRILMNHKFAPGASRFAQDLTVPSGCEAQYLFITSGNTVDRSDIAPWVDNLRLIRIDAKS